MHAWGIAPCDLLRSSFNGPQLCCESSLAACTIYWIPIGVYTCCIQRTVCHFTKNKNRCRLGTGKSDDVAIPSPAFSEPHEAPVAFNYWWVCSRATRRCWYCRISERLVNSLSSHGIVCILFVHIGTCCSRTSRARNRARELWSLCP